MPEEAVAGGVEKDVLSRELFSCRRATSFLFIHQAIFFYFFFLSSIRKDFIKSWAARLI